MTKEGVKRQLDDFINGLIDGSLESFRPWGVIGPGFLPGNGVLMRLFGSQINEEISNYRATYNNEFRIILDAAEEVARGEGDFEEYRDEVLKWDYFYVNYEGDREEEFADDLIDRNRKIAEDLAPLVESDKEDFWEAAREVYTRDELVGKVDHAFSFSDLLEGYEDGIDIRTPPILFVLRLSYTGEGIRALRESEEALLSEVRKKADEVYSAEGRASDAEPSTETEAEVKGVERAGEED